MATIDISVELNDKAIKFIQKYHSKLYNGVGGNTLVKMRREFFGVSYEPGFLKALGQYCFIWNNGHGANPGCCLKDSELGRQIKENVLNGNNYADFHGNSHKLMLYSIKNINTS